MDFPFIQSLDCLQYLDAIQQLRGLTNEKLSYTIYINYIRCKMCETIRSMHYSLLGLDNCDMSNHRIELSRIVADQMRSMGAILCRQIHYP